MLKRREARSAPTVRAATVVPLAVAVVTTLAGYAVHNGTLMLLALTMVAASTVRRWLPWDLAVPAALALLVAGATWLGLGAYWTGGRWISSPASASVCFAVLLALGLAPRIVRARQVGEPLPRDRWTALAFLPTALIVVGAFINAVSTTVVSRWIAVTMDGAEHAFFVHQIRSLGALDFTVTLYPRGLHTLAAIAYAATGQPEDMATQLRAGGALTWLCFALLTGTITALSMRLFGGGARSRALAGLTGGIAVLVSNNFVAMFVLFSAHATMLGLVLVLLPALIAAARLTGAERRMALCLVVPLSTGVVAQLWTALLLPIGVVGLVLLVDIAVSTRSEGWQGRRAEVVAGLSTAALSGPLALPVLLSVQGHGGLSLAGSAGVPYTPSTFLLGIATLGLLGMLSQIRKPENWYYLAAALGVMAMTAVLLIGSGHPENIGQWYPSKALWMVVVGCYAAAVVTFYRVVFTANRVIASASARLGGYARSGRLLMTTTACIVFLLAVGPQLWLFTLRPTMVSIPFRSWPPVASTDNGYRGYELAQLSQRRFDVASFALEDTSQINVPIAVGYSPMFDAGAPFVVSKLLRLTTGQKENKGLLSSACADVRAVAGNRPAVVLTALREDVVRSALNTQGCTGVQIREVPWPASVTDPTQILDATSGSTSR